MSTPDLKPVEAPHANEDPITHEPGAHPVATGVGAMGGGATGAAIGIAMGGPIGAVIGAVVGAVAGGLGGSAVGESIDPTVTNESWPGETAHRREEAIAADASADLSSLGTASAPATTMEEALHTHGATLEIGDAESPSEVSHEAIASKAWGHYEAEGKRDGHALDHWLQAERELRERTV